MLFVIGGAFLGGCGKRPAATEGAPAPVGSAPERTQPSAAAVPAPAADPSKPPAWAADFGPGERGPRGKWLSIVYMGNGQGEIEPCG